MECTFKLVSKSGRPVSAENVRFLFVTPNKRPGSHTASGGISSLTSDFYRKPEDPSMKVLFAADSYTTSVIENYTPTKLIEIELEELENGGGIIFYGGNKGIPGIDGFLEVTSHASSLSVTINAYYSKLNGVQEQPVNLNLGESAILEDESGKTARLIVKDITFRNNIVLIEYDRLSSDATHPTLQAPRVLDDSDDSWEPLTIDRTNPRKVEAAEEVADSLGELNEELRGENGYIASKPEEYAAVSGDIGNLGTKLKTEDIIDGDDIKKTFNAFKILAKIFNKVTRVGMKIVLATDRLVRFMEIVLNRIPENIRDFIKNIW